MKNGTAIFVSALILTLSPCVLEILVSNGVLRETSSFDHRKEAYAFMLVIGTLCAIFGISIMTGNKKPTTP